MALKSELRGSPQLSFLYDEAQNFARYLNMIRQKKQSYQQKIQFSPIQFRLFTFRRLCQ